MYTVVCIHVCVYVFVYLGLTLDRVRVLCRANVGSMKSRGVALIAIYIYL